MNLWYLVTVFFSNLYLYYKAQPWTFAKFWSKATSWSVQTHCCQQLACTKRSEGVMWARVWWGNGNRESKMHLGNNLIKTTLITLSNDGNLKAEGRTGIKERYKRLRMLLIFIIVLVLHEKTASHHDSLPQLINVFLKCTQWWDTLLA